MVENALAKLFSDSSDQLVYHYCSLSAFESIVERGCFWATDLRSMNDPREVKSSAVTIKNFLEGMTFAEGSLSANLLEMTQAKFQSFNRFSRFFCSSFTYSQDDLYSWLNYGSRGAGVALGIRTSAYSKYYWRDVTYSDEVFRAQLSKLWDEQNASCAGGEKVDDVSVRLAIALQKAGVSNKHASWSNEREARLIFPILIRQEDGNTSFDLDIVDDFLMKEGRVSFKSNSSGLRPYIEINLNFEEDGGKKNALASVLIGPNNISEVEVVQAFLTSNGFTNVDVEKSSCEFR